MALADALKNIYDRASSVSGVSASYFDRLAGIESSSNPFAKNPKSSAGGLFQFIDSTWSSYGSGNKFGTGSNVADAIGSLTRDNSSGLTKLLGRSPTQGELYLAHQQGLGGASKLLSNPNASAVELVGMNEVINNGGSVGMTAREFAGLWTGKFDGAGDTGTRIYGSSGEVINTATGEYDKAAMGGSGEGLFAWIGDYFVRGTIIILGFIFVAVGLAMFKPGIVVNALPAGRVASGVKAAAALAK